MEELTERVLLRNLQKEQERERRRLRDRQRRQAMSLEEREKHLARRRRNYQLRRQRARNVGDPQANQGGLGDSDEMLMLPSNENHENHQAALSVSVQSNGILDADLDQRQGGLNAGNVNSLGLEVPAHKLAKLPTRSRLNHIKNLARSLVDTLDIGDSNKIPADLTTKGDTTSDCTPPKVLRLNRVKHLARALSSDVTTATVQNHNSETEGEQKLPSGEHLMNGNMPKVVQTNNVDGGDE